MQVSVDSLNGRHIHIPGKGLPDARHLQPPPNPFSDPRADLLSHVQAAVPCQEVGHISIGAETAKRELVVESLGGGNRWEGARGKGQERD
jgi:hypothetical protein